jgi:Cu/Ag efflux pump CusA
MTSFAFILGVLPLTISIGSGSETRRAVGVAVFFGMLGVTLFGLIFTPVSCMLVRRLFPNSVRVGPGDEGETVDPKGPKIVAVRSAN